MRSWWAWPVIALCVALLGWGIYAFAKSESIKERNCERDGGTRVYIKGQFDGGGTGNYCVKILYKD